MHHRSRQKLLFIIGCLLLLPAVSNAKVKLQGLQLARDFNPDPDIVEVKIEAGQTEVEFSPGIKTKVYTYNGAFPGPLIKAKVGDKLIVHFKNNLPEPTTLHWHGLRVPATMDGANLTQKPVPPGGSFRYEFTLKDASLFWYHPHIRAFEQVEKGLAAPLLVMEKEQLPVLKGIEQSVFVLDDILLDRKGQVAEAYSGLPTQILAKKINGREGNMLLVNGKKLPTIEVTSGVPVRWRLVNVANARFMTLEIPGHKLTRIGGDAGLIEKPRLNLDQLTLLTGQRADILFTPKGKPGTEITVYWKDIARGRHSFSIEDGKVIMAPDQTDGRQKKIPLMKLKFVGKAETVRQLTLPPILRRIDPIDTRGARIQQLVLEHTAPGTEGTVRFTINGKTLAQLNSKNTLDAAVGEVQVWDLVNKSTGDYPFHLHGFHFQVLGTIKKDKNGNTTEIIAAPPIENRDVVNVPGAADHEGSSTTVRIAIKFDHGDPKASNLVAYGGFNAVDNKPGGPSGKRHSGGWLFHSNILEHANLGMTAYIEIRDHTTYKKPGRNTRVHHHKIHKGHDIKKTEPHLEHGDNQKKQDQATPADPSAQGPKPVRDKPRPRTRDRRIPRRDKRYERRYNPDYPRTPPSQPGRPVFPSPENVF